MNIRELKRRLLPYSGYLNSTEDGGAAGAGGGTEEVLDLGNDESEETPPPAAPSPAPAPTDAPASDAAGSGDDADDAGKPSGGIPRARFNEVNDRKKALESEVEALRAQLAAVNGGGGAPTAAAPEAPTTPPVDVDALEEQYTQALLDGDSKAAVAIRKQINQHIEEAALQRFEQTSQQRLVVAKAQDVVNQALEDHPWLDREEGAEALELIVASVRSKIASGVPHHVAMAQAIATIAPRFAPAGTPSRDLPPGGAPVDTRLDRANKRGAADSMLQPAAVQAGMGNRATSPKIDESTKLSDEQIDGLSKAELEKSLGIA